jgi:2-polyprenyl-3-methyl-5-hydroxy-6-metoxy-1,4-benzoquinol methylase
VQFRTKDRAKESARRLIWRADRGITGDLRRRFVALDPVSVDCFRNHPLETGRPRTTGIPKLGPTTLRSTPSDGWLNTLRRLDGARVFEIGCGTGSSIMALVEQGSDVIGIDVVPESIEVSRARLRFFGLDEPALHHLNATDIDTHFDHAGFDLVIFFASLEHMTHSERLRSLRAAWQLSADKGILCIVEAPNRLWLFDSHTADLPSSAGCPTR